MPITCIYFIPSLAIDFYRLARENESQTSQSLSQILSSPISLPQTLRCVKISACDVAFPKRRLDSETSETAIEIDRWEK